MESSSWKIQWLLIVMGIMVASNIYTFIPIYQNIATSISIEVHEVVIAGSMFTFFYACGLLIFANLADRYGRKHVIIFGMAASSIATLFVSFSESFELLALSRGLQGFFLGSFAPVAFAYIYDLYEGKKRTLLLSLINSGFLLAGILGQITSDVITGVTRWEMVFIVFAVVYGVLFLFGANVLPKPTRSSTVKNHNVIKGLLCLFFHKKLFFCYLIVFTILASFVGYYDSLTRSLQDDPTFLLVIRMVGLLGAILSVFTGRFIEKVGKQSTLFIGITLGIIGVSLLLVPHNAYSSFFYISSSIIFVSSISLLIPTIITIIGDISGDERGKALSLYSFILLGGASFAPLLVMNVSFVKSMIIILICFLIDALLAAYLLKDLHNKTQARKTGTDL